LVPGQSIRGRVGAPRLPRPRPPEAPATPRENCGPGPTTIEQGKPTLDKG
jgi:hypothetical protein